VIYHPELGNSVVIAAASRKVAEWDGGKRLRRFVAASLLSAEEKFRRISRYRDLWMISAALERAEERNWANQEENAALSA
jgi:hypothetical protein